MRRRKPLTVAEARALLQQEDLDSVANWKGSKNDAVTFEVKCVVCGSPNKCVILRHNINEITGSKYLCFDCQDKGWGWMGEIGARDHNEAKQHGTVIEYKSISSLESVASKRNKNLSVNDEDERVSKLNDMLFGNKIHSKADNLNPIQMYKPIRVFKDDTLMLHLSHCKNPRDINEGEQWDLFIDKSKK